MHVWGIGEVLWDIFPDQERFGGAALNFCANLQRLGETATLLSAVGDDPRGALALRRMRELGLNTQQIGIVKEAPTGMAVVHTSAEGEPSFSIPRPAAFDLLSVDRDMVRPGAADWLYFGTLLQTQERIERATTELALGNPGMRCFYDMNLRPGHWNIDLVSRLSRLATMVKLNENEVELLQGSGGPLRALSLEQFCRRWAAEYEIDVICVTLGASGCLVYDRGSISRAPGIPVRVCDTVGSGDAFAAAFLHGYASRWPTLTAARFANALGALVASRQGATPDWTLAEVRALGDR